MALQERLSLDEEQLREALVRFPTVLAYSFEKNLGRKLGFVLEELGLLDNELGCKIPINYPRLPWNSFVYLVLGWGG